MYGGWYMQPSYSSVMELSTIILKTEDYPEVILHTYDYVPLSLSIMYRNQTFYHPRENSETHTCCNNTVTVTRNIPSLFPPLCSPLAKHPLLSSTHAMSTDNSSGNNTQKNPLKLGVVRQTTEQKINSGFFYSLFLRNRTSPREQCVWGVGQH